MKSINNGLIELHTLKSELHSSGSIYNNSPFRKKSLAQFNIKVKKLDSGVFSEDSDLNSYNGPIDNNNIHFQKVKSLQVNLD